MNDSIGKRDNLGRFIKGTNHKHSIETRKKIGLGNTGKKKPWSDEHRKKQSIALQGRKFTEEHKRKISEALKGFKRPPMTMEQRIKRSMSQTGAKEFTGFKSAESDRIRQSAEYKQWREFIFRRDDYTCLMCKKRGGKLEADHVWPFSIYPQYRFKYVNGRTLCHECHRKTDTYMGRIKNYKKSLKLT